MSAIKFRQKGSFSNTERFFNHLLKRDYLNILDEYGRAGVQALANATPKDSGNTAAAWNYIIESDSKKSTITFTNSSINKGVNIAIILQYGHGTRTGGYVQGRDYINPSIQPVFDKLADAVWREVTSV